MPTTTPAIPSPEAIRRALGEFEIAPNDRQVIQIQQYMNILLNWNEKMNLTAIRNPIDILYRHFCESMYATVAVPVENGRLADVGSGGGFPGIPIGILRPGLHIFLIESNLKKATFLAEVVREIGLTDVRVLVKRFEDVSEDVAPLDFVCSRALGDFGPLLNWAGSDHISATTVVLWIGGRDLEEIQKIDGWQWREPIQVPQSLRRMLLVGTKKVQNVGAST